MRYLPKAIFVICLYLVSSPAAFAGVDLSVGGGYLANDIQYQIGGRTVSADGSVADLHFPLSELNFPLDSYVVKGQVDVDFADKWALMFNAETNLTDDTGQMVDSDWGVWDESPADQLDIYSKSDTEMDLLSFEGKVTYELYRGYLGQDSPNPDLGNADILFSYTLGAGYKYQKFDFDVYDLEQWYPSAPQEPRDYVDGLVLTYEAEYQIPYLELGMEMNASETFILQLGLAYAPFIAFRDEDRHLLRDKVNKADHGWDGSALMGRLSMRYNFSDWYVSADFEAMEIESEGESKAYYGGVWDHTIDHEMSSHQYRSYLMLGYSF